MPHTFVILVVIILIATALTWVIPSDEYARIEDPISGRKIVDATSFTYVDNVRVSPIQLPMLIINAFSANADLITLILLSGAAIHMLTATGALQALVASIVRRFSGKVSVFIPLLMLVFALICTTQGVNTFIAFAPITVMLALSLGLDSIVGVGIILLGGAIGFSTGTLNVSTTLVAQKIAELPNYSGIGYRWVCFAVFYVITCTLLVRYAKKIQKNPELSPMYDLDKTSQFKNANLDEFGTLDTRKILCIIALVIALVAIVYGCINLDWDFAEQSGIFLVLSIAVGILGGFDANKICAEFMNGAKKMLSAAFIIMFARAIGSVLSAGVITDTIVHSMAVVLTGLPAALLGVGMLAANTLINVVLTSGSGQAAAVMPIMIPLSDLLGVTRQTCILSFNFGDGFCNYILPTSTALMGILGAADVPYDRWMRFMWKIFLVWLAVGAVLVVIAQMINYGPM
ncbi:MAG: YfcC family protein [Lawsonibacter sp.]|nr:YfcC family protein [Lawsonibacter sp.]